MAFAARSGKNHAPVQNIALQSRRASTGRKVCGVSQVLSKQSIAAHFYQSGDLPHRTNLDNRLAMDHMAQ
jgi:hypothetical protein